MDGHQRIFFTVCLADRRSHLLTDEAALLQDVMRACRRRYPFRTTAGVILPARLHVIWQLPVEDCDYGKRWKLIKTSFARHVRARRGPKAAARLWQRRYWEKPILSAQDHDECLAQIIQAPVQTGLVRSPGDWPHTMMSDTFDRAAA